MKIAVIGTGRMGSAMARRLVAQGHDVGLWNRSTPASHSLAHELQATAFDHACEAVADSDVVLASLANGAVTLSVLLDPRFLDALDPATVVCDMGTSGPYAAQRLAVEYAAARRRIVDSPVSGSVPSVISGTLLVMASGADVDISTAEPVLRAFAKAVMRLGPAGAGQSMKLAVNLVVHALNGAVAEGLALAERDGIDRATAYEVLLNSSVAAPYVAYKQASFVTDEAPLTMSIDLMAKDLGLISDHARAMGLDLSILAAARDQARSAQAAGFGASDMADIMRFLLAQDDPGVAPPVS